MLIDLRSKYYFIDRREEREYYLVSLEDEDTINIEPCAKFYPKDNDPVFVFWGGDRVFLYLGDETRALSNYSDGSKSVNELLCRGIKDIDQINTTAIPCYVEGAVKPESIVYKTNNRWKEISGTKFNKKDFDGPLYIKEALNGFQKTLMYDKTPIASIDESLCPLDKVFLMGMVESIETLSHFKPNEIPCIINDIEGQEEHMALYKTDIADLSKRTLVKEFNSDLADSLVRLRDILFVDVKKLGSEYVVTTYGVIDKNFIGLSTLRGFNREEMLNDAILNGAIDCVSASSEKHNGTNRVFSSPIEEEALKALETLGLRDRGPAPVTELF